MLKPHFYVLKQNIGTNNTASSLICAAEVNLTNTDNPALNPSVHANASTPKLAAIGQLIGEKSRR
jgi:hypothetical protein